MAELEILEVVPGPLTPELWGANIDAPVAGWRCDHYAFVVAGWVLSRSREDLKVRVVSDGRTIAKWEVRLERPDVTRAFADKPVTPACGYLGTIRALDLAPEFALHIELEDAARMPPLATIRGRRSPLPTVDEPPLRPIVVTTLGRTGSTHLMQLLGSHPQVVVHPPFPYETRVSGYWAAVFDQLSSPPSYLQTLVSADSGRYWWLGYSRFGVETYLEQDAAARRLGGAAIDELATFARQQVAAFYQTSAALQGKVLDGAIRFAEKQLPVPQARHVHRQLFPDRREIFLVRDFRDMLASILAFDRKRGQPGFGRPANASDEQFAADVAIGVEHLVGAMRATGDAALTVHYEELVSQPSAALERILRFLDLEQSPEPLTEMIEHAAQVDFEVDAQHRTSQDARASIGRYRRDLSPRLLAACESLFSDALAACGYSAPAGRAVAPAAATAEPPPAATIALDNDKLRLIDSAGRAALATRSHFVRRFRPGCSREQTRDRVAHVDHWYHSVFLGHDLVTAGNRDTFKLLEQLQLPPSLAGKTVLDIGSAEGFFSFECEARGAARVISLDHPELRSKHPTIQILKELFHSSIELIEGDLEQPSTLESLRAEVVLFLGVLYHLRDPFLALRRLRAITREVLYLETHVVAPELPKVAAFGNAEPQLAVFYERDQLAGDRSNWWGPNLPCLVGMLRAADFVRITVLACDGDDAGDGRAIVSAEIPATVEGVTGAENDPSFATGTG